MDGSSEAIKRTGQEEAIRRAGEEDAIRRDADQADVEAHRLRGGIAPDDAPGGESLRRLGASDDEPDVEGHMPRVRF
jgi:hypothetical protein